MKHSQIVFIALLSLTAGAQAQTLSSQTAHDQNQKQDSTIIQTPIISPGSLPYSGQTNYDAMGGITQYRAEPTELSYIGVLGEKWETDKRGRRSSFIHNGVEMSISGGLLGREPEVRTDTIPQNHPKLPIR